MTHGGQPAIRGYLVQTLIGLLELLDGKRPWTSVTLEPNVDSEKVDILWEFPDSTKAVQVKSSQNPFSKDYASSCTSLVRSRAFSGNRRGSESLIPRCLIGRCWPGGSYRHSFLSL